MRIALDAMGGNQAPAAMVLGACNYARQYPTHEIILVGQEAAIERCLAEVSGPYVGNVTIHHAGDTIGMADKISALKDKPDDSMNHTTRLVKEGRADAAVLCGNTACSVAASQLHLRRIPGVKRAGILTPLPNLNGHTWIIDCGANSVGKAEHLAQFATMGEAFLRRFSGLERPRIGVLNIGEEDSKGDHLTSETMDLLRPAHLNVVGFVEGNDIFRGVVDLVVCDGFTGNVLLKTAEGCAGAIAAILKEEIRKRFWSRLGYLLMRPAFAGLRARTHWSLVGGCLLLGVNGVVVIGHGRSDATAVYHALRQAARCVDTEVIEHLRSQLMAPVAA